MKTIFTRLTQRTASATLAAGALALAMSAQAVNYAGNGDTGFGGPVGNGILSLTDDGTNIYGKLTAAASLNDTLVIYVDTGAPGGFTSTANFSDNNDGLRSSISGYNGSSRSLLTFTNGFTPLYAIALGPNNSSFGGVWQLAAGGGDSLNYENSVNLSPTGTGTGPFTFSLSITNFGLPIGSPATFKLFGTLVSSTAYRSTEAICGNIHSVPGGQGSVPFVQVGFATYAFDAPPAPTYPVTFSVDMTEQISLGTFNPANGDVVYCGGSFQTNPFAFTSFQLSPEAGNANIYTGTYQDPNPTNTAEQYKFAFFSVANNTTTYDSDPNRPFTLQGGGQILPLVYFNNIPASPSATTNYTTFQIDMTPQIYLGHFNPANGDTIQVEGTFEANHWTTPGLLLTNNPSISASNVYSGTFADGNYPGTVEYYKYYIVSTTTTNAESGANRILSVPTNSSALSIAFFSGVTNVYSTPVSFSVDMTVPLVTGQFNPGNGDICACAGTFETNSFQVGGFILTNNPTSSASNIYSGTYIDRNPPGTADQYKFVYYNTTFTNYEQPTSTGGNNRFFVVSSPATTNPLVYWSDYSPANVVLTPTTITFTVNMTNAVDRFGGVFDPDNDVVMIDGAFLNPQWQIMNSSEQSDPLVDLDFPQLVLQRSTPTDELYTFTYTLPAGTPIQTTYKYGIVHNAGTGSNTNIDNEAGFALNHVRYVRTSINTYSFPVDIFGIQRTNPAAAVEPLFGNLAIGSPSGGVFPISWLGLRNVHLQSSTNLINWVDLNNTLGNNSTNIPVAYQGSAFYRLVQQ